MDVLGPIFGAIAGVGSLGWLTKKVVERLVKWFTLLTGDWVSVAAIAVGWGFAFLFPGIDPTEAINEAVGSPLTDLPFWATRLATGILIAIAAGALADREELKFGVSQKAGESITEAAEVRTFDEGYVDGVRVPVPGEPGYVPPAH